MKNLVDKINILSNYFEEDFKSHISQNSIGLLTGFAGSIFAQACVFELTQKKENRDNVVKSVDHIIEKIINSEEIETVYSIGLSGLARLLNMLRPILDNDQEIEEILNEIDEVLEEDMDRLISQENFDIIHGAIGVAIYLIERGKNDKVKQLILSLDQSKLEIDNEIKWSRFDPYNHNTNIYDFGFAHGMSSFLFFLVKCHQGGLCRDESKNLIYQLIKTYDNNQSDFSQNEFFFPAVIKCEDYKNKEIIKTRLAWCYGDLTILNTLLLVSIEFNDKDLYQKVVDKLLLTSTRKVFGQTFVQDAGFCHGSAGLSSIYLNIFDLTKNDVFKETAEFWLNESIKYSNDKEAICGYSFNLGGTTYGSNISLLSGVAGVLVSYIAALNPKVNEQLGRLFFLR